MVLGVADEADGEDAARGPVDVDQHRSAHPHSAIITP